MVVVLLLEQLIPSTIVVYVEIICQKIIDALNCKKRQILEFFIMFVKVQDKLLL